MKPGKRNGVRSRSGSRGTIMVSGMIASVPYQGGATWAVLQYILGFRRLGYRVCFVEPVEPAALQPPGATLDCSLNAAYFRRVASEFDFLDNSALLLRDTRETVGLSYAQLLQMAQQTDVLINIAGMLTDCRLTERIPVRAYLDLDPGFTQLWHDVQGIDMHFAGHSHHVTIGRAIGRSNCAVPTCGLRWITTLQPVALEYWPVADPVARDALTTVANWRGYGSIESKGVFYGQKAHSLRRLIELPMTTKQEFVLALAIDSGEVRDLALLRDKGWQLVDPSKVANTPASYRRFIQGSKAEFGIAKSGYVAARCGWFSDRSACYLASGRPVIAQETGFSEFLPVGEGLFAFERADQVLAAIDALRWDYTRQACTARAIAVEIFDSDKVLSRLLNELGVG